MISNFSSLTVEPISCLRPQVCRTKAIEGDAETAPQQSLAEETQRTTYCRGTKADNRTLARERVVIEQISLS